MPRGGEEAMDTASSTSSSASDAKWPGMDEEPLFKEFHAWQLQSDPSAAAASTSRAARPATIQLKQYCCADDDDDDDVNSTGAGKRLLKLTIGSSQTEFSLHCPSHYPDYTDEDNFFVEADSGLQLWCNALNEYLLDSDAKLSLSAILNKGLSLYSSADNDATAAARAAAAAAANSSQASSSSSSSLSQAQGNGGGQDSDYDEEEDVDDDGDDDGNMMDDSIYDEDDNPGDDEQLEDILDNDLSWELEIARRKKRWRTKEKELRTDKEKSAESEDDRTLHRLYQDPSTKNRQPPQQVFTSAGASGILINDLVSIMESIKDTGIEADTIDDNIFQWNVKIRNFYTNCVLDKDFQMLESKFGYDYIELQLDFSMDLYPFFPPLVKVIRPRLQGSMMLRVTTMEILKLSYWNPARDMKSVLIDIKSFLQTWARLDLQSSRNDRARYADGAYIDIEHHLLRLALVSEIVPRANKKYMLDTPKAGSSGKTQPPPQAAETVKSTSKGAAASSSSMPFSMSAEAAAIATKKAVLSAHKLSEKLAATTTSTAMVSITDKPSGSSAAGKASTSKNTKSADPATGASGGSSGAGAGNDSAHEPKGKSQSQTPKSKFYLFGLGSGGGSGSKNSEEKKKAGAILKNMAKGVGYSSYQQKGWDVKAYMAAQKEKDKQIELVLAKIHQELKKLHGTNAAAGARNLPDLLDGGNNDLTVAEGDGRVGAAAGTRGGSRRKRKHSPDESNVAAAAAAACAGGEADPEGPIDPLSDLYAVLEGSALVPFLESKLHANSFLEICSHTNVYKCVINIIREIASQPYLVSLLGPLPDQIASLHSLLLSLESQARVLIDKIGKSSANGSAVRLGGKSSEKVPEKTSDDKLARDFLSLSKDVSQALKNTGYLPDINGETGTTADSSTSSSSSSSSATIAGAAGGAVAGPYSTNSSNSSGVDERAALSQLYKKHMQPYQFDTSEFSVSGSRAHHFSSQFSKAGSPSSQIIFRVAQELSSLSTSLPLDFSSGIFIRSDDDRATLLRVIITGPEDTPYSGGCYQFDIYFPPKYPHSPPMINFRTTGGGLVRFNPNLYNCGKVCLSLLGTWEGAQGEQWNETSTLLQVLISIQSLILCAEPYFNEPGFERIYGTPQGNTESQKYSEDVFRNNLKYAVLGQLTDPPEGFEELVRTHFYLKRNVLIQEYEKMIEKTYKTKEVKKVFQDVKRELLRLERPDCIPESEAPRGASTLGAGAGASST